jgi:hypothetical protein
MLTFKHLALLAATICFALALTWLCAAELLLSIWGIAYSYPVGLLGRRSAALFAGVGVMFFCARDAAPSSARSALSSGFIVSCCLLAALGIFELATGHAGWGILSAVVVEMALAAAFWYVARTSR